MSEDLKNTDKDNLFIIFGEPDIDLLPQPNGRMRVKVNGVDAFKPQTGEVISHGANDPYSALKTTLKAEGPGSLGDLELRHLAPIRETEERADRGESNQSSGGMR